MDAKQADMKNETVELSNQPMTTDYGIKVSDPDHWLRVVDEKRTGPSLLEDPIAREKVSHFFLFLYSLVTIQPLQSFLLV